ncbi:MAG: YraN family protein [Pseudomonadales bacterium]
MSPNNVSGADAEKLARAHLEAQGLSLISANFTSRFGEIDLVMNDQSAIVFIEVRHRKNPSFGTALETVNRRKQKKLILAAQFFLQKKRWSNKDARFDVIGISPNGSSGELEYNWCKNAFLV